MQNIANIKTRRALFYSTIAAFLIAVPVLFQNCAAPIDGEGDLPRVLEEAPFAYDTKIDHLAYMSCTGLPAGYNTNAFFTFKAGAYDANSGIRLNGEFLNSVRNVVNSDKVRTLVEGQQNTGVYLSMGVRQASNLRAVFQSGSAYVNDFLGVISLPGPATELVNARGNFVSSFSSLSGARVEDQIHLTANETVSAQVRGELTNGNFLALTYNNGSDPSTAIGPSQTSVHGYGYRMNFAMGFNNSGANFSSGPVRLMTNVREYNLINGQQTSAVWECPSNWTFMIVRQANLGSGALCENYLTEPTPTAAQIEMYQALRKVLPATEWGVNLTRRCLVAKRPETQNLCYGTSNVTINYTGTSCDPAAGTCPHYVSICRRRP
jgi:hypothetical protein